MGIMFKPDMLELVLSGKKTQTRRNVKDADYIEFNNGAVDWVGAFVLPHKTSAHNVAAVYRGGRQHWRVGNTYAVQPKRGAKAVGHVRLTRIFLETFDTICPRDAEAEGFSSPHAFFAKIKSIYGEDFDLEQPCWVLEFKLVTA